MTIRNRTLDTIAAVLVFGTFGGVASAADRPYTEGPVLDVAAIRTQAGMFDEYLKYLAGPYKQLMDEEKKAGIVLGVERLPGERARAGRSRPLPRHCVQEPGGDGRAQ